MSHAFRCIVQYISRGRSIPIINFGRANTCNFHSAYLMNMTTLCGEKVKVMYTYTWETFQLAQLFSGFLQVWLQNAPLSFRELKQLIHF